MPYVPSDRIVHDADAHVVETPDFFKPYADPNIRDRIPDLYVSLTAPGEDDFIEHYRQRHADPEFRARDEEEIMLRKNWKATGSFIPEDRPKALDLIGDVAEEAPPRVVVQVLVLQQLQEAAEREDRGAQLV